MNDYNIITLRLGESDGDIICWINSLPPYTFRKYINAIIISESQQTIEQVPCDYNCIDDKMENIKRVRCNTNAFEVGHIQRKRFLIGSYCMFAICKEIRCVVI